MPALTQLYPEYRENVPLSDLYLGHRVWELGSPEAPFVYANFVASLDGRIALRDTSAGTPYVPEALTSTNDFRLFLELQAQADCLITHGGYLRSLAAGRLGNVLQIGAGGDRELLDWRREQGLSPQPAIVIASASLDFPLPATLADSGQMIMIATSRNADPERVQGWRARGLEVVVAGERMVEGRALVAALAQRGYRSLYLVAGPRMLATMLRDGQLGRLYLTTTHQFFGGEHFHSLFEEDGVGEVAGMRLCSLYYDHSAPGGAGQFFGLYQPTRQRECTQ